MKKFKDVKQKKQENYEILKGITLVTQLGIVMLSSVAIGVFLGIYLDILLNTKYIFKMIFSILGMFAAFRNMYYYTIKKM